MTSSQFGFSWFDYVIFAVMICISLGIGVFHALSGSRQRTTSEYLVGDRKMNYLPVSLSYIATFMSSIFFLGTPAEMYAHGIDYLFVFYGTYLELRFNSVAVRKTGSCFGILTNIMYMGVVLFGPAVALKAVAPVPLWNSVLDIGLSSIIYTAIGGLKAVVWTDVLQSVIMLSGLTATVAKSLYDVGGFQRIWKLNRNSQRFDISFSSDPTTARTFWTCLFGGTFKWISFTFNESSILRYVSIPSLSDARKMMLWSTPTFFVLATLAAFEGLCAFAHFTPINAVTHLRKESSTILTRITQEPGAMYVALPGRELINKVIYYQILPYFLMELFHKTPGLPGLFLASLFSASLSTLSSCLSSVSACTLTDFVRPAFPNMTEFKATVIAKIIVVIVGSLAIGLSFLIMQISGTVTQIGVSLVGAVDGPTCAIFLLGGLVPFANKYGALLGGITGIGIALWISLGSHFSLRKPAWLPPAPVDGCQMNVSGVFLNESGLLPVNATWNRTFDASYNILQGKGDPIQSSALDKLYSLSFLHHTLLGILVTLTVGILTSIVTGPTNPQNVNPAYVSYLVRRFYYSKEKLDNLQDELDHVHDVRLSLLVQDSNRSEIVDEHSEDFEVNSTRNTPL